MMNRITITKCELPPDYINPVIHGSRYWRCELWTYNAYPDAIGWVVERERPYLDMLRGDRKSKLILARAIVERWDDGVEYDSEDLGKMLEAGNDTEFFGWSVPTCPTCRRKLVTTSEEYAAARQEEMARHRREMWTDPWETELEP